MSSRLRVVPSFIFNTEKPSDSNSNIMPESAYHKETAADLHLLHPHTPRDERAKNQRGFCFSRRQSWDCDYGDRDAPTKFKWMKPRASSLPNSEQAYQILESCNSFEKFPSTLSPRFCDLSDSAISLGYESPDRGGNEWCQAGPSCSFVKMKLADSYSGRNGCGPNHTRFSNLCPKACCGCNITAMHGCGH